MPRLEQRAQLRRQKVQHAGHAAEPARQPQDTLQNRPRQRTRPRRPAARPCPAQCTSCPPMSCSVHKRVGMLHTPSTSSSMRRPGSLMERLAAVLVVAQPDRQGQLGKADRRRVALVRWFDICVRLGDAELGREAATRRVPKSRPTACLSASADTVRHASSRRRVASCCVSIHELHAMGAAATVSTLSLIIKH